MARLNVSKMEKKEKAKNSVHEEAVATYSTFIEDGKKYFQIDTYRRKENVNLGSASQNIQLDKESAIKLIELLQKTFSL